MPSLFEQLTQLQSATGSTFAFPIPKSGRHKAGNAETAVKKWKKTFLCALALAGPEGISSPALALRVGLTRGWVWQILNQLHMQELAKTFGSTRNSRWILTKKGKAYGTPEESC